MSDTITLYSPDELAAMAERERAASPPLWFHETDWSEQIRDGSGKVIAKAPTHSGLKNARFIAHARNEYARLLAVAQWAGEAEKLLRKVWDEDMARDHDEATHDAIGALLARLTPPDKS